MRHRTSSRLRHPPARTRAPHAQGFGCEKIAPFSLSPGYTRVTNPMPSSGLVYGARVEQYAVRRVEVALNRRKRPVRRAPWKPRRSAPPMRCSPGAPCPLRPLCVPIFRLSAVMPRIVPASIPQHALANLPHMLRYGAVMGPRPRSCRAFPRAGRSDPAPNNAKSSPSRFRRRRDSSSRSSPRGAPCRCRF